LTGVFQDLLEFLAEAKKLVDKNLQPKNMFDLVVANAIDTLDIQMSTIANMCSALQFCQYINSDHWIQLQGFVSFIMDILKENVKFGMQVAEDVGLEVLRLYHLAEGLKRLDKIHMLHRESRVTMFLKHMRQLKRYTPEMQGATQSMLKEWGISNIPEFEIKIKVPVQPLTTLWSKCQNNHLNFSAFLPIPKTRRCDKCDMNLTSIERPEFKKAPPPPQKKLDDRNTTRKNDNQTPATNLHGFNTGQNSNSYNGNKRQNNSHTQNNHNKRGKGRRNKKK
jgi:hypothetical protein